MVSDIPDGQLMENRLRTMHHPHKSDDGNVVAVHNGIIENYQELKDKLVPKVDIHFTQRQIQK